MLLEQVEECPICQGKSFQPFLICKDYTTSGKSFHVEQCTSCKMLATNPRPTQTDSTFYYQSPGYISHTSAATGIIDYIYLIIRQLTLRWKYNIVKSHIRGGNLLDVGSGTGNFISYCSKSGVSAYGIEPSTQARTNTRDSRVTNSLETLPSIKFNVITLWHVLEHIYDLAPTLHTLKEKLTDHGIIFIAVPNRESPDALYYKERWAAYDVPRHLWHFSKTDMNHLLKKAGLKVVNIRPMKLDAYYVSLLSEKYSGNGSFSITKIIKAVLAGYRSNRLAKQGTNYSSLIYVVQR